MAGEIISLDVGIGVCVDANGLGRMSYTAGGANDVTLAAGPTFPFAMIGDPYSHPAQDESLNPAANVDCNLTLATVKVDLVRTSATNCQVTIVLTTGDCSDTPYGGGPHVDTQILNITLTGLGACPPPP